MSSIDESSGLTFGSHFYCNFYNLLKGQQFSLAIRGAYVMFVENSDQNRHVKPRLGQNNMEFPCHM